MTIHNDPHEDAFFRAGSEGTYEGGPRSLIPVKLEDWAEPPALEVTEERLERRKKLQRLVLGVMAVLGGVFFLGASVRLVLERDDGPAARAGAAPPAIEARTFSAPAAARPVQAVVAPPVAADPVPVARPEQTIVAPPVVAEPAPEVQATPAVAATPAAKPVAALSPPPAAKPVAALPVPRAPIASAMETPRLRAPPAHEIRRAKPQLPSKGHEPPTASFPD